MINQNEENGKFQLTLQTNEIKSSDYQERESLQLKDRTDITKRHETKNKLLSIEHRHSLTYDFSLDTVAEPVSTI